MHLAPAQALTDGGQFSITVEKSFEKLLFQSKKYPIFYEEDLCPINWITMVYFSST